MAAKGQLSAEKFSRWGITASNLREHLEEMPHVAADLAEMDRLIAEAQALESQQEAIRGTAREVTAQLKELAKNGEKLRSRLRAADQDCIGTEDRRLPRLKRQPTVSYLKNPLERSPTARRCAAHKP